MKKVFTLFVLCLALAGWAQSTDYSGIQISFNKSTATVSAFTDVAVVVKDLDGNVIPGVTAEAISSEGGEIVSSAMGSAAALTWTTGAIIGARYNNNNYPSGYSSNYVIKISGLRSGFTYNMADVDLYGCNRLGAACSSSSIAIAVDVQTGSTSSGLSSFVSSTGNNIDGSQEGGLWHKVSSMISNTTRAVGAEEDLYVKVVIQKTNDSGTQCRPCFRTLTLSQRPTFNVTYRIKDVDDNTIFTSDPIVVESGTTITTLPSNYQRPLFYDYNPVNVTVTEDQTIDFTATLKSSAPFIPSASPANPVWHSLTLSATPNYVTYSASSAQNVTLPTSNADDATTHWAFIGSPYDGFTIINRAAGTSLVLGSDVTTGSSNTGGNVYATLAAAGSQTNEVWTVVTSSNRPKGFYLQNSEGHRLNKRNGTSNVSYWTGGSDAGSTFVATKLSLTDLIVTANALKTTLTDGANTVAIGYPTAAALATFGDAIDVAQGVLENGGDSIAGYDALRAAMTAVQSVANTNYTPRTDVYYTITSDRGSMIYDANQSGQTDATYGNEFLWYTTSLDATNANHQWGFIEKNGTYYMYNVGKMQFANVTQGGSYKESNGDKHTWMFSDAPSSVILDGGEGGWVATPKVRVRATSEVTGKQYAMSISTSYVGPVIAYDAVNDGGIPMTFAVATTTQDATVTAAIEALLEDLTPYRDALQQAINDVTSLPTGVGLNQYTITSGAEDLANALVAAQTELGKDAADQTKESLNTARTNLETAVSALVMTLNMPTAGTFLRIKSAALGTYVTSTLDASVSDPYNTYFTDNADASDPGTIWYYTADNKLLNYATGVNSNSFSAAAVGGANGVAFDFQAATNGVGKYWVHSSDDKFWYAGNPTLDNYSAPQNTEKTLFELEEVTELPFTISAAGQATLALPTAWEVPTGVTVRYASTEHDGLLTVEDADASVTAIAADEAVILVGTPGDYTITLAASGETLGSILTSTGGGVNVPAETKAYILALNGENQVVFALLNDSERDIVAFKAYYISTAAGAAPAFLLFEDGTVTGINAVNAAAQNGAAVYDLQGRRVSNAQKGVYIINGQKVLVK